MAAKKKEPKKRDVNQVAKFVLDKALERAEKRDGPPAGQETKMKTTKRRGPS
jgi:hypothetical protein